MLRAVHRAILPGLCIAVNLMARPLVAASEATAPTHTVLWNVSGVDFRGLRRTNEDWLREYIGYDFPARLTTDELEQIEERVRTLAVFSEVRGELEPGPHGDFRLKLHVAEKWTTIPVFRAAYGGGTPLTILGFYDIHTFGQRLTLGAEARKYGEEPPGFVIYGRDHYAGGGRFAVGGEFWREYRTRRIYGRNQDLLGEVKTRASVSRGFFLLPLGKKRQGYRPLWKIGPDVQVVQQMPAVFEPSREGIETPGDFVVPAQHSTQMRFLQSVQYDDVTVDNLKMDGFRLLGKAGPVLGGETVHGLAELEGFYYDLWSGGLNLAIHGHVIHSTSHQFRNLTFLGGFDSIRGLPDGVLYGSKAAYLNVELRHVSFKWKYLWIQNVLFVDSGGAGSNWADAGSDVRSAAGFGMRFSIPQIHRLVIRIDYARGLRDGDSGGITAGMNQFFQPYRPL